MMKKKRRKFAMKKLFNSGYAYYFPNDYRLGFLALL